MILMGLCKYELSFGYHSDLINADSLYFSLSVNV